MKVRPELTLFWQKPRCFSYANDAILMLISRNLCNKSSEVTIKTRSTPASLSFKGQATKHLTVKWSICKQPEHKLIITYAFFFKQLETLNTWNKNIGRNLNERRSKIVLPSWSFISTLGRVSLISWILVGWLWAIFCCKEIYW